MAKTIDELKSAAAIVRDASEEHENTALRVGQLLIEMIETLPHLADEDIAAAKANAATALTRAAEALTSANNATAVAAGAQNVANAAQTSAAQSQTASQAATAAVAALTALVQTLNSALADKASKTQLAAVDQKIEAEITGRNTADESMQQLILLNRAEIKKKAGLNDMGVLASGQEQKLVVRFVNTGAELVTISTQGVYYNGRTKQVETWADQGTETYARLVKTLSESPSTNVIYCDEMTNTLHRWTGTEMVQVGIGANEQPEMSQGRVRAVMPLTGKKVVMLGDSIHEFTTEGIGIVEHFAELSGATVYRCAVGGGHLSKRAATGYDVPHVVDALTSAEGLARLEESLTTEFDGAKKYIYDIVASVDIMDVDIVTVMAGTNDWASVDPAVGLGTDNDTTEMNNISGAVKYIIDTLLAVNPRLKIVFFTPIPRAYNADLANFSDTYIPYTGGYLLPDLCERVMAVCKINHIPCGDMYWGMGWNKTNLLAFAGGDGVHPMQGFREMAEKELAFILSKG